MVLGLGHPGPPLLCRDHHHPPALCRRRRYQGHRRGGRHDVGVRRPCGRLAGARQDLHDRRPIRSARGAVGFVDPRSRPQPAGWAPHSGGPDGGDGRGRVSRGERVFVPRHRRATGRARSTRGERTARARGCGSCHRRPGAAQDRPPDQEDLRIGHHGGKLGTIVLARVRHVDRVVHRDRRLRRERDELRAGGEDDADRRSPVSSLRPFELMLGKGVGVGAGSIFQFAIWGLGGRLVLSQRAALLGTAPPGGVGQEAVFQLPPVPAATVTVFLAYFLGGFFLYSAMFAAVGAMSSNEQEARQAQQPVVFLLMIAYLSVFALANDPGSTYAVALSLVPFTSPIAMPVRWAAGRVGVNELTGSLELLGAGIGGVTWIAARIYRVGILMTGKRPNLQELIRWVRA